MRRLAVFLLLSLSLAGCAADREAAAKSARLVELHTQLGAGYLQRNQLDVAREELESALKIDPSSVQANNMMALLQSRLKDFNKADMHFRRALESEPENGEVQNNYGVFLCEQGKLEEAEVRFKKAIADPRYKTPDLAYLNAGLCMMKKPDPQLAAGYFRAALDLNPRLSAALYHMAKVSLDSGQTLSARGYMQRYFEVAQDSPEALWLAIRIERALGSRELLANYGIRLTGKFANSPQAKTYKQQLR